jgi:hypothetical protein
VLRGVKTGVWEGGDQKDSWNSWGLFVLVLLGRVVPEAGIAGSLLAKWDVRPVRLEAAYSQTMPRREQRVQVGFSLLHLSLELAQPVQLSLSLRGFWVLGWRARRVNDSRGCGAKMSAMIR